MSPKPTAVSVMGSMSSIKSTRTLLSSSSRFARVKEDDVGEHDDEEEWVNAEAVLHSAAR